MSSIESRHAIVGLGISSQGRLPEMRSVDLRIEGLRLALKDAGLSVGDVGGYIYQPGVVEMGQNFGLAGGAVPKLMGMRPNFVWQIQSGGVSTIASIAAAGAALDSGVCDYVAVGYGDTLVSSAAQVGAMSGMPTDTAAALRDVFRRSGSRLGGSPPHHRVRYHKGTTGCHRLDTAGIRQQAPRCVHAQQTDVVGDS